MWSPEDSSLVSAAEHRASAVSCEEEEGRDESDESLRGLPLIAALCSKRAAVTASPALSAPSSGGARQASDVTSSESSNAGADEESAAQLLVASAEGAGAAA